jgi:hypothetical protein
MSQLRVDGAGRMPKEALADAKQQVRDRLKSGLRASSTVTA